MIFELQIKAPSLPWPERCKKLEHGTQPKVYVDQGEQDASQHQRDDYEDRNHALELPHPRSPVT